MRTWPPDLMQRFVEGEAWSINAASDLTVTLAMQVSLLLAGCVSLPMAALRCSSSQNRDSTD